jgi:hypothetical protein
VDDFEEARLASAVASLLFRRARLGVGEENVKTGLKSDGLERRKRALDREDHGRDFVLTMPPMRSTAAMA